MESDRAPHHRDPAQSLKDLSIVPFPGDKTIVLVSREKPNSAVPIMQITSSLLIDLRLTEKYADAAEHEMARSVHGTVGKGTSRGTLVQTALFHAIRSCSTWPIYVNAGTGKV